MFVVGCGAIVDGSEAVQTLNDAGYTKVKVISNHFIAPTFYGCSKEDDTAFECSAVNPAGKRVNVVVCSNLMFKSSTIRH